MAKKATTKAATKATTKATTKAATKATTKAPIMDMLSMDEKKRLRSLETTIRTGRKAWYRVGLAVTEIRDSKLYRETHSTGDLYFADKFDMTRQYVSYLISAVRIHDHLKASGFKVLPATESQCRPFRRIPEDMEYDARVVAVWTAVVESGDKVTAKCIDAAVDKVLGVVKKAVGAGADADAGDAAGDGVSVGSSDSDGDKEAELREIIRDLKAKTAYLESQLAMEKKAHQRTKQAKGDTMPTSKLAKDLFKAGFRAMAKACHPDMGGTPEAMSELESLRGALGI